MVAQAEFKLCSQCIEAKPIEEFRRRSRIGTARLNQCRGCHNLSERNRRAKRQARENDQCISSFTTRLKREPNNRRVELLCAAMVDHFGGVPGFVNAWIEQFERAMAEKPGSKNVFDSFQAVMRMSEYISDSLPDVEDLTDEQLQQVTMHGMERLIQVHPELAVECAERIGWTVSPTPANTMKGLSNVD